jgi:hypothetical protein
MTARSITLAEAKVHLRITTPAGHVDDPDVQQKLDAAEALVFGHVGRTAAGQATLATWIDAATTPPDVRGLVLLQLGELWRFRGDDVAAQGAPRDADAPLSPLILNALRRYSDPVLQ